MSFDIYTQLGISQAMVNTFADNTKALASQTRHALAGAYTPIPLPSLNHTVRSSVPRSMREHNVRGGDTVTQDDVYVYRQCLTDFADDAALYWKDTDSLALGLTDPTSDMARRTVEARNRWKDKIIAKRLLAPVAELSGTGTSGINGIPVTKPLPASSVVATNLGGNNYLNLKKVSRFRQLLKSTGDDGVTLGSDSGLYLIVTEDQIAYLLENVTQTTSSDYTSARTLERGAIDGFMGFKWIELPRKSLLPFADSSGNIPVIAFSSRSIEGNFLGESVQVTVRADKKNALQILNQITASFTRRDDELVATSFVAEYVG